MHLLHIPYKNVNLASKNPFAKQILHGFLLVTMKVLNSYILVIIDIVIKLIIEKYFWENRFVIGNLIGFKPYLNTTQLSILNNELALGVSTGTLIVLNIVLIPGIPLSFYWLNKDNEFGDYMNISENLLLAGAICSLLDKIIWGGSLNYIYLLNRWIVDLKDIYLFGAICVSIMCGCHAIKQDIHKRKMIY